jgi:SlyX protein
MTSRSVRAARAVCREKPMEKRIIELETKVAFQEDTILKLRDAVAEQEKQLYRISKELAAIRRHLIELGPVPGEEEDDSPPPHY